MLVFYYILEIAVKIKCIRWFFLTNTLDFIVQSEHNQFNVNSIKHYLSNINKKEIKAIFAYFYNDSCQVPGGPP